MTDGDSDPVTVTVTVTGLPSGLSYTSDEVQGTVAADATAQAYTVTITADDGENAAVTETFTVTGDRAGGGERGAGDHEPRRQELRAG